MKAEDTVIKLDKVSNVSLRIAMESILLEQAEITWDKAYKAGQKEERDEILAWLILHKRSYYAKPDGTIISITSAEWTEEEWQAKLKELGL